MGRKKNAKSSIQEAAKNNAAFIASELSGREKAGKLLKEYSDKLPKTRQSKTNEPESLKSVREKQLAMKAFATNQEIKKQYEYCTIEEFEQDVFSIEGIQVVVRGPKNAQVMRYPYKKRASSNTTLKDLLIRRIERTLQHDYEVEVMPKGISLDTDIKTVKDALHCFTHLLTIY